MQLQYCSLSPV